MDAKPNVIIYTTPTCGYCKLAKAFFDEHGVEYEEKNVATDLEARKAMIEMSGQMGVPVILVSKHSDPSEEPEIVVGFNQGLLMELLGIDAS